MGVVPPVGLRAGGVCLLGALLVGVDKVWDVIPAFVVAGGRWGALVRLLMLLRVVLLVSGWCLVGGLGWVVVLEVGLMLWSALTVSLSMLGRLVECGVILCVVDLSFTCASVCLYYSSSSGRCRWVGSSCSSWVASVSSGVCGWVEYLSARR